MHHFSALAILALSTQASAQAFNIDIGGQFSTPPSSSYGAAASQPGYWNAVGFENSLADVSGNSTLAQYFFNASGASQFSIPDAEDGDKQLMESAMSAFIAGNSLGLVNVNPGLYDLYVYSWAGLDQGVNIQVSNGFTTWTEFVNDQAGWTGQLESKTYARFEVEVLSVNRGLGIFFQFGSGDVRYVNGLQLVPIPAPASAVILFPLALAARRRR